MELVKTLRNKQEHEKMNDTCFAKKLGISRSLWVLTQVGKREIGFTLLRAIVQHYPELIIDVIDFLKNGASNENGNQGT